MVYAIPRNPHLKLPPSLAPSLPLSIPTSLRLQLRRDGGGGDDEGRAGRASGGFGCAATAEAATMKAGPGPGRAPGGFRCDATVEAATTKAMPARPGPRAGRLRVCRDDGGGDD